MGLTNLDDYWHQVSYEAKERIRLNKIANIRDTIDDLQNYQCSIPAEIPTTDDDVEHIEGLLTESGEYYSTRIGKDVYIKKDPSFNLNRSIIKLNSTLFFTNIITTVVAIITGVFIVLTFYKNNSKTTEPLNPIINNRTKIVDSTLRTQKKVDSVRGKK